MTRAAEYDLSDMPQSGARPDVFIKVLHLEDNITDAQLCLYKLRASGMNVQVENARSGKEFREKVQSMKYDLILGDYRLPDWSGLDAVRWLRVSNVNTPFILLTGTLGDELAVECIKRGATDYVLKENLDRLPLAMRRALEEQAVRAERDRAQSELLQREREYRSVVQGAPYGIYRADRQGNILMANPALVTMLGYGSEDEVLKLNTARDVFVRPEERDRAVMRAQNEGISRSEHLWRRKDGKEITVRLAARRVPDDMRTAAAFEVFAEDITAQRNLELQFLQAQKMEAVGRLAGGVAHDFNNLLMIISSCLELWQHEKTDPEKAARYIRQIREATTMAAFVVRQLLTFSRKQMLERQVVDLNSVLKDLNKMLPRLLGEDVDMVTEPGDGLERIEVDRGHIEQVVMNLAVNARDAMPGGGTLTIRTANAQLVEEAEVLGLAPGPYVKLSVADTGTGMDEQTQARIFEPFFTTKEQGKGTGLGLATVSSIVKQNAGGIQVRSRLGEGTVFDIYFPVATRKDLAEAPLQPVVVEGGSETVLIVEDEASLRTLTTEYLQSLGYTVLAASNGFSALDICRTHSGTIDLMLTDVVMPGLSGPEVVEEALAMRPEMHVIYASGYIDRQVDLDALESGAFLQKPYGLVDLNHKIRAVLAG